MRLTTSARTPRPTQVDHRTDRGSWVVQGWVVTDPEALARMDIPSGETCVEIPDRMIQFFGRENRGIANG